MNIKNAHCWITLFENIGIVLVTCLLVAFASRAFASTATVSWANPTTNTDGTAIPATGAGALASTRVEYGTCSAANVFGTKAGEVVVNQPATSTTIQSLTPGSTYCFRAYAKNSYGAESAASNVASKLMPTPTPNPPVLSATITVAYDIQFTGDGSIKLGRAVGQIGYGTTCEPGAISTNKGVYYEVSLEKVVLERMPRSAIVVTKCAWSS